jgi:AAHS family 4-hydroxybenzoate transporter-like MFS transporter
VEAHDRPVTVARIIDDQRLNSFSLRVIAICFLVVLVEGYEGSVMAFALPGLSKAWKIGNAAVLGPVLSASIVGMVIGSALFGYLGDRFGRRKLIIGACWVSVLSAGMVLFATSLDQLFVLRLLAGIGVGGAAPNAIALTSEFAPSRQRAMLVTVMFSGIGLGALPGIVSSLLVAKYGWLVLFWIGAVIPLIFAVVCFFWLPESPAYLITRSRSDEALATLKALAPNSLLDPSASQPVAQEEPVATSIGVSQLFRGGLASMTILFWIALGGNLMTYFVLLNWTPALLSMAHLPLAIVSLSHAVFQVGGVIGGVVLGRSLDRRGPAAMALFMLFSIPPTITIGFAGSLSPMVLLVAEFVGGFFILGTGFAFAGVAAMIYPTRIRSSGAGWGFGVGRLGAIVSTVAAGALSAYGIGLSELFLLAAAPLLVSGLACLALARRQAVSPPRLISEALIGFEAPLSTQKPSAERTSLWTRKLMQRQS